MKKLALLILTVLLMSCEDENRSYTLEYVVFYPGHNDTVILRNTEGFYWGSDRGTNYIKKGSLTGSDYYDGSAPYKILQYTYIENNEQLK